MLAITCKLMKIQLLRSKDVVGGGSQNKYM